MEQLYADLQQHLDRNFTIKKTIREKREMVLSSNDKAYLNIDWTENVDIKIPAEVQSAFFSNTSISIHNGYLYSAEDSGGFAALSDCKNHKAEAIHTAIQPMIEKLVDKGIKSLIIVSDSPTSKYRNNKKVWLTKQLTVHHKMNLH